MAAVMLALVMLLTTPTVSALLTSSHCWPPSRERVGRLLISGKYPPVPVELKAELVTDTDHPHYVTRGFKNHEAR